MLRIASIIPLLLAFFLSACGGEAKPTPAPLPTNTPIAIHTAFPLTITDSLGKALTFDKPPQRIVSFSPAHTEILFALGAGQNVVGTDTFSDYPPEANDTPKVGDAFSVNLEKLASLEPDLIYVDFESIVPAVERVGSKVLFLKPPNDLDGVMGQISLLGKILDKNVEAEALIAQIKGKVDQIKATVASMPEGPRVFLELDPLLFTVGPDSFIGETLKILKAKNVVLASEGEYPQLSAETIVQRDPQVILLLDGFSESPETVSARAGWKVISAVREGRVYLANSDLLSRPGPRIAQGIEEMAKLLYPELFR